MSHCAAPVLSAVAACLAVMGCAAQGTPTSFDEAASKPVGSPAQVMASQEPPAAISALAQTRVPPPRPALSAPAADKAAVLALMADMRRSLPGTLLPDDPAAARSALSAARTMMDRAHAAIDARQVVLVVDRSAQVQRLWVAVAYPGARPWDALGVVRVSTGKPGRKEHFRTPVGVFANDASILGYRAEGTYNEHHIRGIGVRGMRVWDFGWQTTDDWRTPGALMAVRMEMHATDPAALEPRLGRWDSEGCIRIPSRFNAYLDHAGLIDTKLRDAAATDRRFAALLPRDAMPSPLAGAMLVIVDSSEPGAAPSDPVRANAMEHPDLPGPEHDSAGPDSAG